MFYKDKKVLVTGGTGFIGTHFVEALLAQGAQVRITVHNRPPIVQDERIETVQADLTRLEACREAAQGMEYVIHAAGAVSAAATTVNNPMSAITDNLVLTARMMEAAWLEEAERFLVFSSGTTAYPLADYPISEDEMWTGDTYPGYFGYGWMRRYLERLAEFTASKSEMGIALIRPTAVYGRHDNFDAVTSHVIPALIRRAVEGQAPFVVWGTGEDVRDFLHVTDLIRGCLLVLEKHAVCDPVNIGYGEGVAIKDVVKVILKAAGREDTEIQFDASKPSTIPVRLVDTSKAKKLLGFEPSLMLEEGLQDTVAWFRETHPVE